MYLMSGVKHYLGYNGSFQIKVHMYGGKLEGKDVQTMAPFQFFKHLDKLFETWSYKTLVERIDISCKSTCFEGYFF